jgi:hypothetical protein
MHKTGFSGLTNLDISTFLKRDFNENEKHIVDDLITEIEDQLCEECNREFDYNEEYVETFNPPAFKLVTDNMPIVSVESLKIGGVESTDYTIYNYYIELGEQTLETVELTYTIEKFWGKNIILFLKKWIAYEFLNSENAGVGLNSMGFADISQTFDVNHFLKEKDKTIFKYRIQSY